MIKRLIILGLCLLLISCTESFQKTPEDLADYILTQSLTLHFTTYKNTTAFGSGLSRKMKRRYKMFKGFLSSNGKAQYQAEEVYWYGINAVIDLQISSTLKEYTLEELSSEDDLKIYAFEGDVEIIYLDGHIVNRVQKGQLTLSKSLKHWNLDRITYENDIFKSLYE